MMDLARLFFGCSEHPTAVWGGYVITPGSQKGVAGGLGESYFKVPAILVDNGHSFFMTNKRK